ncbi:DNA primase family protein [Tautonia plasticadhaerens]|uniref:DNA primase family protein n=1 Tax=Tautonia plasticadhaerens TaxID=2527974 RepID=UPI0018D2017F|nr:phage/plasmid primase, P4 family [Tautonia plasticadhaerens]
MSTATNTAANEGFVETTTTRVLDGLCTRNIPRPANAGLEVDPGTAPVALSISGPGHAHDEQAWTQGACRLAVLVDRTMVARRDAVVGYRPDQTRPSAIGKITRRSRCSEPIVGQLELRRHFGDINGLNAIALFPVAEDGTCRWVGWDIDAHAGDDEAWRMAWDRASTLLGRLVELGIEALLEYSGGGFHLWSRFQEPIPQGQAFRLLRGVRSDRVDGVELFPGRANRPRSDWLGTALRLPGRHPERGCWSRIWAPELRRFTDGVETIDRMISWLERPGIALDAIERALETLPAMEWYRESETRPRPGEERPSRTVDADLALNTSVGPLDRTRLRHRLRRSAREVASTRAGHGERRQVLNRVAFEFGGYIHHCDLMTFEQASRRLWAAARVNGMAREEPDRTRRTIEEGLRDGANRPLSLADDDRATIADDEGGSATDPIDGEGLAGTSSDGLAGHRRRHEAPDDPDRLARISLVAIRAAEMGLVRWNQQFYTWHPDRPAYVLRPEEEIRATVRKSILNDFDRLQRDAIRKSRRRGLSPPMVRKVTPQLLNSALDAIRSEVLLPGDRDPPTWIGDCQLRSDPHLVLPMRGTLLDLSGLRVDDDGTVDHASIRTMAPTSDFFSLYNVPYDYDPEAMPPGRWFSFLDEIFPGDEQSLRELRKWFGYLMLPDTSRQAILMLVGASRSGKGTIARVLRKLIGEQNVASPAMSELAGDHGLQDLIGKSIILFSDARLAGDGAKLALAQERLLKISGEDPVRINPKFGIPYTTTLPGRIIILSNEVPSFRDNSQAFVNRARPLKFGVTFAGREDRTLTGEGKNVGQLDNPRALAGIANWALGGIGLLRADGRFQVPETARPLLDSLLEASVPLRSFVDDWLDRSAPEHKVPTPLLYAAYLQWRDESGISTRLTINNLVRQLGSICPTIVGCGDREKVLDPVVQKRLRQVKGIRLAQHPRGQFLEEASYVRRAL